MLINQEILSKNDIFTGYESDSDMSSIYTAVTDCSDDTDDTDLYYYNERIRNRQNDQMMLLSINRMQQYFNTDDIYIADGEPINADGEPINAVGEPIDDDDEPIDDDDEPIDDDEGPINFPYIPYATYDNEPIDDASDDEPIDDVSFGGALESSDEDLEYDIEPAQIYRNTVTGRMPVIYDEVVAPQASLASRLSALIVDDE